MPYMITVRRISVAKKQMKPKGVLKQASMIDDFSEKSRGFFITETTLQ